MYTYADFEPRVKGAAQALVRTGARSGDHVAVVAELSASFVATMYAALELGVPLVLMHPRWTDAERRQYVSQAEPVLVIDTIPSETAADWPSVVGSAAPQTLAAILATSGTSQSPKRVMMSRGAFIASAAASADRLGWERDDRWLLALPPSHIGGLSILTRSLAARRCVVLSEARFDASSVAAAVERDRVTLMSLVPTMLSRLVEHRWKPPRHVRAVLVGGARLDERLRTEAVSLGVPVLGTYGCTEACSQVTTQSLSQIGLPGSGSPLKGIDLRIVDGRIEVGGPTMMLGYASGEDGLADGWFDTGDLGRIDADGQLHVLGRADDLIVVGGENVSPVEVEAAVARCAGVQQVCAFGIEDADLGQRVAIAVVVDAAFRQSSVPASVAHLASFKRPTLLAKLDALAVGSTGKTDRRATAALAVAHLAPLD